MTAERCDIEPGRFGQLNARANVTPSLSVSTTSAGPAVGGVNGFGGMTALLLVGRLQDKIS